MWVLRKSVGRGKEKKETRVCGSTDKENGESISVCLGCRKKGGRVLDEKKKEKKIKF